ncbi:receptor-like protein kinase [Gossypium australe]|uniref:Receptor-like protein kinase n=1 Tax=Gossypium australe TaxID=47621 RepID=A0A5B6WG69_9ROSI|nr:receptor-like protein kinase [Gossypium australe]
MRKKVSLKVSPWKKVLRFGRKGKSNPSHLISLVDVEIQADLTYSEELIRILACEIKHLRNKHITLVKVLWHKHRLEEAMWELEEAM